MNIKNIIYDYALNYGGNFANIDGFCIAIENLLKEQKITNYKILIEKIKEISNSKIDIKDEKQIINFLLINDLKKFDFNINYFVDEKDISNSLYEYLDRLLLEFEKLGLNIEKEDIKIYICDKFPKPYDNVIAKALAPSQYDSNKYGIKKGVYLLNSNLSYYQSRILLAHEVTHQIIHKMSYKESFEGLVRGLEEGICELLGSLYINLKLFPIEICKNYIRFRRLKYNYTNQKFKLYTDYMRMAYNLYLKIGINGIVNLINKGRKEIKKVETLILQDKLDEIIMTEDPIFDKDFENIASKLLLSTPENEVLSPLAYYVLNKYDDEKKISDFSAKYELPLSQCNKAFLEIQDRIYGCVISEENIEFSDMKQIKSNGNLKYEI